MIEALDEKASNLVEKIDSLLIDSEQSEAAS
jgi:hypothetical protein